MLRNKHLFCSASFGEREIRLTAGTSEFTRVSGACNGEFGGAAVSHVAHFAIEIALSGGDNAHSFTRVLLLPKSTKYLLGTPLTSLLKSHYCKQ